MKELDPTIRKISEHYDFDIKYDEELDKWIIQNKFKNHRDQYNFYWSDNESFGDFLDTLRQTFVDDGCALNSGYY